MVGPGGRVLALEVDEQLAAEARRNLSGTPIVEVRHGNGTAPLGETFDAILINAGVTHARDEWLDAVRPGGHLVLPLTAAIPQTTIGKGPLLRLTRAGEDAFDVKLVTLVAIYSAVGVRDDALGAALGKALMGGLFAPIKRLRRDRHEPGPTCWLHGPTSCFSTA